MKHYWAHYFLWFAVTVATGSTLLTGCGQKNDLYLPEDSEPREQRK